MKLLELHARENVGMPNWRVYRWECFPKTSGHTIYYELEGCICPDKTKGKNKGRPNWAKKLPESVKTIIITPSQHEEWKLDWQRQTGNCLHCVGEGTIVTRWSSETGVERKPCAQCNGTGKKPAAKLESEVEK